MSYAELERLSAGVALGLQGLRWGAAALLPLGESAPEGHCARATVLITDRRSEQRARRIAAAAAVEPEAVCVDESPHAVRGDDAAPGDGCLVVYTSRTTGAAQGVVQSQASLLHSARVYAGAARLGPGDRLSLLHPQNVIASATTLFGALSSGATVVPFRGAVDDPPTIGRDATRWREFG